MSLVSLPVDQLAGVTLGRYRVEQLLGCGKLNAIYTVRQQGQDSEGMLTVFIIPDHFSSLARERFMNRFQQEMALLKQLQHPYILPVYDYGEQYGYPYFVTPLVTSGSLAKTLKQQTRFAPAQALEILKQVSEGLDFAHSAGIVHGSLKPANILLNDEQKVLIAGFGLVRILAMHGIEHSEHPYAHLFSIAGTFLGAPEYLAPEVVEGAPGDARSDVYALGIVLFELLSGRPPFSGSDPLAVALQHVQQPVPSLKEVYPDASPALDLVLQQALARDPAQRFSSAGRLAHAFERVLQLQEVAEKPPAAAPRNAAAMGDAVTMPPTVNWFEEELMASSQQGMMQADPASAATQAIQSEMAPPEAPSAPDGAGAVDPFVWWSTTSLPATKAAETGTLNPGPRPGRLRTKRGRAPDKSRRRTVALLATGGVIAAGVLGAGGLSLAHLLKHQSGQTATQKGAQTPATANTRATQPQSTPASTATSAPTSTPTAQQKQKQPTSAVSPTPTMQPPTPTPTPGHTGTVIGSTNQGTNTARLFTNPADGRGSWLIHLPGGSFVAFERACTHQGVPVNYNAGSGKLVCPAHGAIFDPANGAQVVRGPANRPLASVPIHVNGDGTITTG
jgi:serine/threonine protein kinase/Rieske Fe-S protein